MIQQVLNSPDLVHQALLPLDKIKPSLTNPRKRISDEMIADLADSIAKVGVLQPILVRPCHAPNATLADGYEIVAGECRYRAASQAGLEHIPATIRNLTDLEALELQVLENLHRNDLHPMEEAEGFRQLLDANGYTAATLASKIGKSKAYVYAALKLCELCQDGRDAFFEGKLNSSTALLIARIPGQALQKKALKQITKENYNGDVPSYREAARIIHQHYTLNLEDAIFDVDDPNLFPGAPDCQSCEKRSGNCRDLYPDIKSANVCTDPVCYQNKRQAHIDRLLEDPNTITGEEAKAIMPHGEHYVAGDDYAKPSKYCGIPGIDSSWEELLGDELPTRAVIVKGQDPVTLVDVAAARKLAEEKGLIPADVQPKGLSPHELAYRARNAAKQAERERRWALFAELHKKISKSRYNLETTLYAALPMLLDSLLEQLNDEDITALFGSRGEMDPHQEDEQGSYETYVRDLDPNEISILLVELIAATLESVRYIRYDWEPQNRHEGLEDFYHILAAAGIDPEQSPETPTSPMSAAHAEIEIAREENHEAEALPATEAAQAPETDANCEETHIEAAVPAAPEGGRPKSQAAEPIETSEQSQATAVAVAPKKRGRPKKVLAAQSNAEVRE